MQRNIVFIAVICLCAFVSCKKKYECDCKTIGAVYMSNEPTDIGHTDVYSYKAKKKDDARTSCFNDHNKPREVVGKNGLDWTLTTCDIK